MVNVIPFVAKLVELFDASATYEQNYNSLSLSPFKPAISGFVIYDVSTGYHFNSVTDWFDTKKKLFDLHGCYADRYPTHQKCSDLLSKPDVYGTIETKYPISSYPYEQTNLHVFREYKEYSMPYIVGDTEDCLVTLTHMVHKDSLYEDVAFVKICEHFIGWIALEER